LSSAEGIRKALEGSGLCTASVEHWETPSLAQQTLYGFDRSNHVIVLTESAEEAMIRIMDEGTFPSTAVIRWKRECQALLSLFRSHRGLVTLVSLPRILAHPTAFSAKLRQRLGIESAIDLRDIADCAMSHEPPARWKTVLAHQAIGLDPEAQKLNGELEAALLPLGSNCADPDATFSDLYAFDIAVAEIKDSQHRLHDALIVRNREREQLAAQHEEDREVELVLSTLLEVQAERTDLVAEKSNSAALIRSLHQDLEEKRQNIDKLTVENARLDGLSRQYEALISELYNSTSWRITAPLRRVRISLSSKYRQDS
jgi:hypothetical protein